MKNQAQLENLAWLSGLAHQLVQDSATADDACQEAWLASSRRGVLNPDKSRLAIDLRRFLSRRHASETRRARREAQVAVPAATPSAEESAVRREQERCLWIQLSELDEPFASTLLRRFREGHSVQEIAVAAELSEDTVRWRIRRGLKLLRDLLERHGHTNHAIALAIGHETLGPTHSLELVSPKYLSKAKLLSTRWLLTGTACSLAFLGASLGLSVQHKHLSEKISVVTPLPKAAHEKALAVNKQLVVTNHSLSGSRSSFRPQVPVGNGNLVEESRDSKPNLVGNILDAQNRPLVGVSTTLVRQGTESASTTTKSNGAFALPLPSQQGVKTFLEVNGGENLEHLELLIGEDQEADFAWGRSERHKDHVIGNLLLRRATVVSGQVVDGQQKPIEGVRVSLAPGCLVTGCRREWTNKDGEFSFCHVVDCTQTLKALAPGYFMTTKIIKDLTTDEHSDLGQWKLHSAPRWKCRVVDQNGQPIANAQVSPLYFTEGWTFDADERGFVEVPSLGTELSSLWARADGFESNQFLYVSAEGGFLNASDTGELANIERVDGSLTANSEDVLLVRLKEKPRLRKVDLLVIDSATKAPLLRYGLLPYRDGGALGVYWGEQLPQQQDHPEGRAELSVSAHKFVVAADGYLPTICNLGIARRQQVVALDKLPKVTGRIVVDNIGAAGVEVQLWAGRLDGIQDSDASIHLMNWEPSSPLAMTLGDQEITSYSLVQNSSDDSMPAGRVALAFSTPAPRTVFTDSGGRFSFEGVRAKVLQVYARNLDGHWASSAIRAFPQGQSLALGDLVLRPSGQLRGQLEFCGPVSLAGHRIRIDKAGPFETTTDASGAFLLSGLPPGGHFLQLDCAPGAFQGQMPVQYFVSVRAGQVSAVHLSTGIAPTGKAELRLTYNGAPCSITAVKLKSTDFHERWTIESVLDENGEARVSVPTLTPLQLLAKLDGKWTPIGEPSTFPIGSCERSYEHRNESVKN